MIFVLNLKFLMKFTRNYISEDQILKTKIAAYKTKTTGSKQRHLANLTFK